jgi:hypothetical protein
MVSANGKWTLNGILTSVVMLCLSGSAHAQMSMQIPESMLMRPWEQHLTVLQSLETTIFGVQEKKTKAAVIDALFSLEPGIGEYESQVGEVINRLAGDPQFAYVAGETSLALSIGLDEVYAQFENLYGALGVSEREDVRAAQQSLDELRSVLKQRRSFETDVENALGSGVPQIIIGLATRWWHGAEKAAKTREHIAALRPRLEE